MKIYIHTINGQPGVFDGDQVCYAPHPLGRMVIQPAYSLNQIRREQRHSKAYRRSRGFVDQTEYGYRRYEVESTEGKQ